jgi:hypothetical protein
MDQNIQFLLRLITTEQFAILDYNYSSELAVNFEISSSFGSDTANRIISPFIKCVFRQNNTPFIVLETACHFLIEEETWKIYFNEEDELLTIPQNFAQHLVLLSTSTARGVLHAKTEHTIFSKYVVPIIDVQKLVSSDVTLGPNETKA